MAGYEGALPVRGPKRHFTHSKVMTWVAVDRVIKAVEHSGLDKPVEHWRQLHDTIRAEVCQRGFDAECNSFVQYYDGPALDTSLLMIQLVGFLSASEARVRKTVEAIERQLTTAGFVARYPTTVEVDGLLPGDGAFPACPFSLANTLALMGPQAEARQLSQQLLTLCNNMGLLSEQYDTAACRLVGNLPQALSHVALINTACNLSAGEGPAAHREQS